MSFLLNNYKGNIDFFKHKFAKFENPSQISHFAKNLNLVTAQHNDTLYEVLQKLRENRVSMVSIERKYQGGPDKNKKSQQIETMGLVFLTDFQFILKQSNFHELLSLPVYKFVMSLNGTEDDRKAFNNKVQGERFTRS